MGVIRKPVLRTVLYPYSRKPYFYSKTRTGIQNPIQIKRCHPQLFWKNYLCETRENNDLFLYWNKTWCSNKVKMSGTHDPRALFKICQFQTRKLSETVDGFCLIFQLYFPIFSAPDANETNQHRSTAKFDLIWPKVYSGQSFSSAKIDEKRRVGEKEKWI